MTTSNREITRQESAQPQAVERTRDRPVFAPNVDIVETGDQVYVMADLPGVSEEHLDITAENGVLTIRGRADANIPGDHRLLASEYAPGDFERVFSLSEEIDQEQIKASVKHGALHLHLPKAAPARARKIKVTA